jgi:hypothetical protein
MANPSGLKPATIEAMFATMTGNDPNQKWKLDERTGELVEDNEAGGDGIVLTSTSHPISEDALETVEIEIDDYQLAWNHARRMVEFALCHTPDMDAGQIIRGVMTSMGGKFNPDTVRQMIDERRAEGK